MQTITPGYRYIAENFQDSSSGQTIQFIQKRQFELSELEGLDEEQKAHCLANGLTLSDGTTNEELLKVLIDRIHFLQGKQSCRENAIVLTHLETALLWLGKRTADRQARGVEGTQVR